jgi:ADP-dependent phosphofructokinase/glucokinase
MTTEEVDELIEELDETEIQEMLKSIPNNFPVCKEDLKEIFKDG